MAAGAEETVVGMSDAASGSGEDKRQRWRMIASLLGAPVPDEPEAAPPAEAASEPAAGASETASETPPRPRTPKPPRADRAPGDWHSLCAQLGIEPPPPPVTDAQATSAADGGDDQAGCAPAVWDAVESEEPSETPELPESVDEAPDDWSPTYFDPDAPRESEAVEDWDDQRDASPRDRAAGDERRERAAPDADEPAERKRRRRRKRRNGERTRPESEVVADSPAGDEDAVPDEDGIDADLSRDELETRPPRGEGARGRRSARHERRDDVTRDTEAVPELIFDDEDGVDDEEDLRYRDHPADDDDDTDDSGDEAPGGEGRAKHKKIPTWEETIGVIVANNMELHRREGNGKGRPPRGRRRGGRNGNDRR